MYHLQHANIGSISTDILGWNIGIGSTVYPIRTTPTCLNLCRFQKMHEALRLYNLSLSTEMAERHDVQHILKIARELVHKVQSLMDNKWLHRRERAPSALSKANQTRSAPGLLPSSHWPVDSLCLSGGSDAGVLPQSVYIRLRLECPWCLFRHVDLSACFVSLITLWAHSRVSPPPLLTSSTDAPNCVHGKAYNLYPSFIDLVPQAPTLNLLNAWALTQSPGDFQGNIWRRRRLWFPLVTKWTVPTTFPWVFSTSMSVLNLSSPNSPLAPPSPLPHPLGPLSSSHKCCLYQ